MTDLARFAEVLNKHAFAVLLLSMNLLSAIARHLLFATMLLIPIEQAFCQELEARTYANTPTGINIVALGYTLSSGNILLDPALPIENLDGDLNIALVGYARTFSILGHNAKFKTFVPYAFGDWKGTVSGVPETRTTRGAGDVRLKLEWNFYGAPAMTAKEFTSWEQKTIVGGSILIVTPTGQYEEDEFLNLGSNRWVIRPELGVSRALGKWTLEIAGNIWLFGDNDEFFGDNRLEQDPLYVAKAHLIYTFRPGLWLGLGTGFGNGGQTLVNGVPRATQQDNFRLGVTGAYPFNRKNAVIVAYTRAENSGAGAEFDALSIGYQYAWGGD